MPNTITTRMLIIGAGPAGYTAAIYAARASLDPVLVAGLQPGGQLMITTDVENYPGFEQAIQGPWLMEQMQKQAEHVGTRMIGDIVMSVDFSRRPFRCIGDGGDVYLADTVVIATGAQARWLGLPSESRLQGAGVSACATCDGFFYRGKTVAVVGGGNTAVEEALYLTHHAEKVTLVHRRNSLRAEKILQARLFAHPKIEVIWDSAVEEVLGAGQPEVVTGLRLRNVADRRPPRPAAGRRVHRHRPHAQHRHVPRPGRAGRRGLRPHPARHHADRRPRRLRRRRRAGQAVAPGHHRRGHRLHGGAGSGALHHPGPGRADGDGARRGLTRPGTLFTPS